MAPLYEKSKSFQRYNQGDNGQRLEGLPAFKKSKEGKLIVHVGERYCRCLVGGQLCFYTNQFNSRSNLVKHIKLHGFDVLPRQTVKEDGRVVKRHGLSVQAGTEAQLFYDYLAKCHDAFVAGYTYDEPTMNEKAE